MPSKQSTVPTINLAQRWEQSAQLGPLPGDGAKGTALLADCEPGVMGVEILNLLKPEKVQALYSAFLSAGARVLVSNTFCCDPDSLEVLAQQQQCSVSALREQICQAAVLQMRKAIRQYVATVDPEDYVRPYLVGSMGPGWKSPSRGEVSMQALQADYAEWAQVLLLAGVDAIYLETVRDPRQAEAAVMGILQAQERCKQFCPIAVLLTLSDEGQKVGDFDSQRAFKAVLKLPIQALGVNCSFGPAGLQVAFDYLSEISSLPLLCAPNAGPPDAYLSPRAYVEAYLPLIQNYPLAEVRGCCGVEIDHIKALKQACLKENSSRKAQTK